MMNGAATEEHAEMVTTLVTPSLPVNVKELVPFTPSRYDGQADAPVYYLRQWTPPMRNQLGEALVEACVPVSAEEMDEATREAIGEVLEPEAQPDAMALLDERDGQQLAMESGEDVSEDAQKDLQNRLKKLERELRRGSPTFRKVIADRHRWNNAFSLWAVRLTLKKWEHLPATFTLSRGLPSDEVLAAIPSEDFTPLANQAASMMSLTEQHRKN